MSLPEIFITPGCLFKPLDDAAGSGKGCAGEVGICPGPFGPRCRQSTSRSSQAARSFFAWFYLEDFETKLTTLLLLYGIGKLSGIAGGSMFIYKTLPARRHHSPAPGAQRND
jgi:hypothetical protein